VLQAFDLPTFCLLYGPRPCLLCAASMQIINACYQQLDTGAQQAVSSTCRRDAAEAAAALAMNAAQSAACKASSCTYVTVRQDHTVQPTAAPGRPAEVLQQLQTLCCRLQPAQEAAVDFLMLEQQDCRTLRWSPGCAMPLLCLQIKGSLLTWLQQDCTVEQQALPPFLRNKLAQAIVGVVKAEYPTVWPNFFRSAAVLPCQTSQ
jgi:hypothetical protein